MEPEDTVTILRKEYENLVEGSLFLQSLMAAGIDNTDAYSFGCELFYQDYPEYDN